MATRSTITAKCSDGKFRSIYCHFDGYISGVGHTLLDHYTDQAKIDALVQLGSISSLSADHIRPPGHTYRTPLEGYTVAYHRDRGEPWADTKPGEGKNATGAVKNGPGLQEYNYVWDGSAWAVDGKRLVHEKELA